MSAPAKNHNSQELRTNVVLILLFVLVQMVWFSFGTFKPISLPDTSLAKYFLLGFARFPYFGITNILIIVSFFLFVNKKDFLLNQLVAFLIVQIVFFAVGNRLFSEGLEYILGCFFVLSAAYLCMENLVAFKLKNMRIFEAGLVGMLSGISIAAQIRELGDSFGNPTGSMIIFLLGFLIAETALIVFSNFFLNKILSKNNHIKKYVFISLNTIIIIISMFMAAKQFFF